ncbi:MAG: hypothetical protein JWP87_2644 [Labilithrix sp.]|nr:hypothetical protein [Labilithrix sp.]
MPRSRRFLPIALLAVTTMLWAADASAQEPLAPDPVEPIRVRIRAANPHRTALVYARDQAGAFVLACRTPCHERLPPGLELRIKVEGSADVQTHFVPGSLGDEVDIIVAPPSRGAQIGGGIALGLGAVATIGGGYLFVRGSEAGPDTYGIGAFFQLVGGALALIGVGVVATGIALVATHSSLPRVRNSVPGDRDAVREDAALGKRRDAASSVTPPRTFDLRFAF